MKKMAIGILCICMLLTVCMLCPVSASANEPARDDVFFDTSVGNPDASNTPEDGLSGGTVAVILIVSLFAACALGYSIYYFWKKKKKKSK